MSMPAPLNSQLSPKSQHDSPTIHCPLRCSELSPCQLYERHFASSRANTVPLMAPPNLNTSEKNAAKRSLRCHARIHRAQWEIATCHVSPSPLSCHLLTPLILTEPRYAHPTWSPLPLFTFLLPHIPPSFQIFKNLKIK